MPGDLLDPVLLDLVLLVAAAVLAVAGYRQGLLVGVLQLAGVLGGALLGARVAPDLLGRRPVAGLDPGLVALAVVVVLAAAGQLLARALGGRLRRALTWRPARLLDAGGGAAAAAGALLLVAWLLGSAVASVPYPPLASQVRRSVVLGTVDGVVPEAARRGAGELRRLVGDPFPDVLGGLSATRTADAAAPDAALADTPAVAGVREEVLKITGVARACDRRVAGTGFVVAPERLLTNAHVVSGVDAPEVEVGGRAVPARVVAWDPARDLAVLLVPGLDAAPLPFADRAAAPGDGGVVVGYPQDGPFRAEPARVRERQRVRGPDVTGARTVVRDVYALRARVRPGASGGPLLDPAGRVLGVVFAAAADVPDTGYALTAAEAAPVVEQGRAATAAVGTGDCG